MKRKNSQNVIFVYKIVHHSDYKTSALYSAGCVLAAFSQKLSAFVYVKMIGHVMFIESLIGGAYHVLKHVTAM